MKIARVVTGITMVAAIATGNLRAENLQQPRSIRQTAFEYDDHRYFAPHEEASESPSDVAETDEDASLAAADCCEADCGGTQCGGCGDCGDAAGLLGFLPHGYGGITAEFLYTGEVFSNMRGGLNDVDATKYTGRFDTVLSGDLDKMNFAPGGVIFLHFQSTHGEGITDRFVGAHQRISNIDGNPGQGYDFSQMSQYWWQRTVIDDLFAIRIGKIFAEAVFAGCTLGGDFINTSTDWDHTIPLNAYPSGSAGIISFFQLTDRLDFNVGVFDGAPDGKNWGFSGTGDIFSIYQFDLDHTLRDGALPGDSRVGIWYHNGVFADQAGGPDHTGNHGVYYTTSQMIVKEGPYDLEDAQGLGAYVQCGWAPQDRNVARQYWGAGLLYTGILDGRDADTCGIAVGNMTFGDRQPMTQDETMIELMYKARIGDNMFIQPDLQYIASPNGVNRDSFIFGLRFQAVL